MPAKSVGSGKPTDRTFCAHSVFQKAHLPVLQFEPTFPLNEAVVADRIHGRLIRMPWYFLLSGFAKVSEWLGARSRTFNSWAVQMHGYLYRLREAISHEVRQEVIGESNQLQDREMQQVIRQLQQRGGHNAAVMLRRFLQLKQRIEFALSENKLPAFKQEEIERLVDLLVVEIAQELIALEERQGDWVQLVVNGNESELNEFLASIQRKTVRVYDTHRLLNEHAIRLTQAGSMSETLVEENGHDVLDQLLTQLDSENRVVQRIQERIQTEMNGIRAT